MLSILRNAAESDGLQATLGTELKWLLSHHNISMFNIMLSILRNAAESDGLQATLGTELKWLT